MIKDCPFCGGKAKVNTKVLDNDAHIWISCTECGAASPIFSCASHKMPRRVTKDEPILKPVYKSWNRRA